MDLLLENSRVERFDFFGRTFFLKRDDLLHPCLNGNKARKFFALAHRFPPHVKTLISHGGTQSNAMFALSCLAQKQGAAFLYYVKNIPSYLRQYPNGNYLAALKNGMQVFETGVDYPRTIEALKQDVNEDTLFIPQGGAGEIAERGVQKLAAEVENFAKAHHLKNPVVITSSGTGTTAFYLQKHCKLCEVYTVPCVGDKKYLLEQMSVLGEVGEIFILDSAQRYTFGKPYAALYEMYKQLLDDGVVFDLLYDVKTWLVLGENLKYFEDRDVIFIHSGGVQANASMLERYKYSKISPCC